MLRSRSMILIAAFSSAVALCSCGGNVMGTAEGAGGSTKKFDGAATGSGGTTGFHEPGVGGTASNGDGTGGAAGSTTGQPAGGVSGTGGKGPSTSAAGGSASGGGVGNTADAGGLGGRSSAGADGSAPRNPDASGTGGQSTGGLGGTRSGGTSGSDGRIAGGATGSTDAGAPGTGGRSSGTGGSAIPGTGGSGTGGRSAGTGGTATGGTSASAAKILWTDTIQTTAAPWALDGWGTEHPVGTTVTPGDANGANFSVVPDPLGGSGRAIRHFATFDTGGSRSQAGIYSDYNTAFGKQAKSAEGVWVAQEWYFPSAIDAKGEAYCWINLWDFHSVNADRSNRWHTSPGLMLAQDGSMKVQFNWGGPAASINQNSKNSSIAMPVGRWFDIEMHYAWADTPTATLSVWIDGQLALEQSGVQTRDAAHQIVETYLKFYGSTQGHGAWTPTPSLKYTRNVRVAGERIWR